MNNTDTAAKPKNKKRKILIILLIAIIVLAALLTAIYIRVNPTWRAANLTIEKSDIDYHVQNVDPDGATVSTRIVPPEGYTRIPVDKGSFGEYLRNYPVLPDGVKLPVYDGSTMSPYDAAAIFDISLGDEGYQQCADSIIRLYSDYFYENKQYDKISFQFSNGDECSYERWRDGHRMLVLGGFSMEIPAALSDDSEQQYRNYLKEVMNYAGTISLQNESKVISVSELKIGDFICSDSHVVMIVDIAENDKGEKCYLIGQSFIPAVCFHIVINRQGDEASAWFTQKQLEQDSFEVGVYSFDKSNIRRWKDGF